MPQFLKVVSKILEFLLQNTRKSMSHRTHDWTFNLQFMIFTVQGVIFCQEEYFQQICLHLKPIKKYFDLILCILEFRFCIFEGQAFYIVNTKQNSTNLTWHFITNSFVPLIWHSWYLKFHGQSSGKFCNKIQLIRFLMLTVCLHVSSPCHLRLNFPAQKFSRGVTLCKELIPSFEYLPTKFAISPRCIDCNV